MECNRGERSSRSRNGGDEKCAVIPPLPERSATAASGRADAAHRLRGTASLRPQQHERRHSARGEIELAGEKGVVDGADRAEPRPLHLELREPELLCPALDQALVA